MTFYIAIPLILLFLSSSCNYVAFNHVQRYKYYKNVSSASFAQYFVGIIAGLPLIFIPFVSREKDQDFMKYEKVKNAVLISRTLLFLLITSILILGILKLLK